MKKRYPLKFWVFFWLMAGIFLVGWLFYWQTRNTGIGIAEKAAKFLPTEEIKPRSYVSVFNLLNYFLKNDEIERNFLVLFQNNMEIRPGGGFIGSFAVLKIKNGKVIHLETFDSGNFDDRIPDTISPPYPMAEKLKIKSWKLRDSNWSPDFETNALKAAEFYRLGGGTEEFAGIIGITTNVLTSLLKVTGPVKIEGYPGTYTDEKAVLDLEYQVEKAFEEQGIPRRERKSIITLLAREIANKVSSLDGGKKIELAKIFLEDLNKKDIQLYFKDPKIQQVAESVNWAGRVDANWNRDYLMISDANLGAFKSDYFVKRSYDYAVDLAKNPPEAVLKITYNHTAEQADWMTKDYTSYLRVYASPKMWLNKYPAELGKPRFAEELGKKYFGFLVYVPLAMEKTFEFNYTLPEELKTDYDLKIQKQAGINDTPVVVRVTYPDGNQKKYNFVLKSDIILSKINE